MLLLLSLLLSSLSFPKNIGRTNNDDDDDDDDDDDHDCGYTIIRQEIARMIGGLHVRCGIPMEEQPRRFFREIHHADQVLGGGSEEALRSAARRLCDMRPCCQSLAAQRTIGRVGTPENLDMEECRRVSSAVHMAVRPTIKATERDHAGNRYRGTTASGRTRSWRRQVAQYIVTRSRERFIRTAGAARRLKFISQMSWRQFRARASLSSRSGIGGSGKREYINLKSKESKGRWSQAVFQLKRVEWAQQYDALDAVARGLQS